MKCDLYEPNIMAIWCHLKIIKNLNSRHDINKVICETVPFELNLENLQQDQFIVKIEAVPINPLDLLKINGHVP